jgi:hypothetical protein
MTQIPVPTAMVDFVDITQLPTYPVMTGRFLKWVSEGGVIGIIYR